MIRLHAQKHWLQVSARAAVDMALEFDQEPDPEVCEGAIAQALEDAQKALAQGHDATEPYRLIASIGLRLAAMAHRESLQPAPEIEEEGDRE